MREIKFRAWYVKEKQMLEVNHLFNLDNEQPIEVWTNDYEGGYRFNPDKSEIMQYTGLNDINGKPIYEGDIVKAYRTCKSDLITFANGSFGIAPDYLHSFKSFTDFYGKFEVIGNKFQNPELLEAE